MSFIESVNVTILLVALALASTTISLFWANSRRRRYILFFLAAAASLGAIYQAYDDEVKLRHVAATREETSKKLQFTSGMVQHLVTSSKTLPVGFNDKLAKAVASVGKREGYAWSRVWLPSRKWGTGDFGYLLGFDDPKRTDPHPEHLDSLLRAGYERGFVYIPKHLVYQLVLESLKGGDIEKLLYEGAFWRWQDVNDLNAKFVQSMSGIVREMYTVATNALPSSREFLKNPENITVRIDAGENWNIQVEVKVKAKECKYIFANTNREFLRRLVKVDPILRGGRIAAHFLAKLRNDFSNEKNFLVCEHR